MRSRRADRLAEAQRRLPFAAAAPQLLEAAPPPSSSPPSSSPPTIAAADPPPAGSLPGEPCHECGGSGRILRTRMNCLVCRGHGTLERRGSILQARTA